MTDRIKQGKKKLKNQTLASETDSGYPTFVTWIYEITKTEAEREREKNLAQRTPWRSESKLEKVFEALPWLNTANI